MVKKIITILLVVLTVTLFSCDKNEIPVNTEEKKEENLIEVNYEEFQEVEMQKDDIKLFINGKRFNEILPIYLEKNRYFISLNELVQCFEGKIKKIDDTTIGVYINEKEYIIDKSRGVVLNSGSEIPLKKELKIFQDNYYFISLIDISNIFNMYTYWDRDNKTIYCKTNDDTLNSVEKYTSKIETLGFLRLEDVTSSMEVHDKDYFNKLRIIGRYLSEKGVPYHIAWIPRSVDPPKGYDLDPLTQNNFILAEMIYSLDYISNNSGVIGLHGYTHQNGNEISGVGYEFGYKHPDINNFKERIEMAINTAKELDIKIDFFEAPHYAITSEQNKVAEGYFKYIYHPFSDNGIKGRDLTKPQISPYNNSSYYFSTPLEYVPIEHPESMITKINNNPNGNMGSLFFHPRLEYDKINITIQDNNVSYSYDENSILHGVINALNERGYKMSKVTDVK